MEEAYHQGEVLKADVWHSSFYGNPAGVVADRQDGWENPDVSMFWFGYDHDNWQFWCYLWSAQQRQLRSSYVDD